MKSRSVRLAWLVLILALSGWMADHYFSEAIRSMAEATVQGDGARVGGLPAHTLPYHPDQQPTQK